MLSFLRAMTLFLPFFRKGRKLSSPSFKSCLNFFAPWRLCARLFFLFLRLLRLFAAIQDSVYHPIQITIHHSRPRGQTKPPLKQILRHLSSDITMSYLFNYARPPAPHLSNEMPLSFYFIGANFIGAAIKEFLR